jgi:hypothetical protein
MANIYNKSLHELDNINSHSYFKNKNKLLFIDEENNIREEKNISIPSYKIIERNYDYLKIESEYEKMDNKYINRPDYLSYDKYGTVNFWFILMYINDCFNIKDFNYRYVYIPSFGAITELIEEHKPQTQEIIYNQ